MSDRVFGRSFAKRNADLFGEANHRVNPQLVSASCTSIPLGGWPVGTISACSCRYRLRLINIVAFLGGTFSLKGTGGQLQWHAVAKDGADLPPEQAIMQEARQAVLPGETYDFWVSANVGRHSAAGVLQSGPEDEGCPANRDSSRVQRLPKETAPVSRITPE